MCREGFLKKCEGGYSSKKMAPLSAALSGSRPSSTRQTPVCCDACTPLLHTSTTPLPVHCHLPGEAALKSAQLELQLQTRKQEAEVEMLQTRLQQQAAALVS